MIKEGARDTCGHCSLNKEASFVFWALSGVPS